MEHEVGGDFDPAPECPSLAGWEVWFWRGYLLGDQRSDNHLNRLVQEFLGNSERGGGVRDNLAYGLHGR